ncbi:TonB-dependent receptor [Robertkochia marina]|uniref:TonB-dependent receptor n=1 Tax=Robertkochia marina TaxID=1227945 RepID=A0A4S3M1V3_9FLAO|nr:TonB-dependent receptor [Robertkochia marina]THD68993.1 TonB-dependent receptor [Robertkochia marina]TRZ44816.1 TonB-dependent receptor [Robertkochia marina]
MKIIFYFLGLFLGVLSLVNAQEYRVYGTFKDQLGEPVPGVTVKVRNTSSGTTTDTEGAWELFLDNGNYELVFYYSAPKPLYRSITVNETTKVDVQLDEKDVLLDEVLVSAVRVDTESPVSYSDLSAEEFAPRNLGQDIPILMNYLPGVVTTSDAGAGVGYTGIRVRGSDATRVNVTINGIPYNDAESQGTFWVNLPDFASSVESLQLQRGVGTSTNGAGAFGASLNLLTDAVKEEAYAEVSATGGSFNTLSTNLRFGTGLMNDHVEISGRLSRIQSDGYIDRASSDLESYFLQGAYVDDNTLVKALLFGGQEVTYQAWYGIEDPDILENNRTFNIAGAIYNDQGEIVDFYDNEVDNYKQDHAQLHWSEQWSPNFSSNLALHYTYGRGFFEQYRQDDDFATYGFDPLQVNGETVNTTDLIRRRWLDNDFYGATYSFQYNKDRLRVILGGAWNKYEGDHFGEVIWAQFASQSQYKDRYYDDTSLKTDFNVYGKINYRFDNGFGVFGDLQYRTVNYQANGNETGLVDDTFNFFNPKVGLTYRLNEANQLYASFARANREPNRNDYESGNPKPERLNDFELGWRYRSDKFELNSNVYYMRYQDQLVLTGELNDVGAPLRRNVGDSYRLGLELDATVHFGDHWAMRPNLAISDNRNLDYFFERDGVLQDLGNTNIAYSPNLIAGNMLGWYPAKGLQVNFLSKYVSEQYLGNIDAESSKLDDYFINDLNLQYTLSSAGFFKEIVFSGLVNNIFDVEYISNGYFYTFDIDNPDGSVSTLSGTGYYPQAGINFLVGMNVRF